MTDYTGRLRLALQILNENAESWGSILNQSVFQLLEDGISGSVDVNVASADQTLTSVDGGTDTARYMRLNIIGAPGVNRNVNVPEGTDGGGVADVVNITKAYLVTDNTTGGFDMTVKTVSGSGVIIPSGKTVMVYSDGTNVIDASHALTSDSAVAATLATDSNALGTFSAALYPRLALANVFSKAQNVTRVALTSGATVATDASLSNAFFLEVLQNFTLSNPTNPVDGQVIRYVFKQGAGGPYTITFGTAFAFQLATHPALTPTVGRYDYFSAEYDGDSAKWFGAMLVDMRNS